MLRRIIALSVRNRLLVVMAALAAMTAGVWALRGIPLEALPDGEGYLVEVQVFAVCPERS